MTHPAQDFIELMIGRFKRAATVALYGDHDEDNAMQLAGIRAAKRTAQEFDAFGPDARGALAALLDDPDMGVRAFAAGYLLEVMPERALTVLKDVDSHGSSHERMTASNFLSNYERRHSVPKSA